MQSADPLKKDFTAISDSVKKIQSYDNLVRLKLQALALGFTVQPTRAFM